MSEFQSNFNLYMRQPLLASWLTNEVPQCLYKLDSLTAPKLLSTESGQRKRDNVILFQT